MLFQDAYNCISDFDEETNTALFAVYDGHEGNAYWRHVLDMFSIMFLHCYVLMIS